MNGSRTALLEFAAAAGKLRVAAESGDIDKVLECKGRLYEIMLGNCRNDLVREVLQSLFSRINLLRATSLMHPDRLPHSLEEIDGLAAALLRRDADRAQSLASLHVANASRVALKMLEGQEEPEREPAL